MQIWFRILIGVLTADIRNSCFGSMIFCLESLKMSCLTIPTRFQYMHCATLNLVQLSVCTYSPRQLECIGCRGELLVVDISDQSHTWFQQWLQNKIEQWNFQNSSSRSCRQVSTNFLKLSSAVATGRCGDDLDPFLSLLASNSTRLCLYL